VIVPTEVMFGLLAALGWGVGDFLISRISRALGVAQSFLVMQGCGLIAILAIITYSGDWRQVARETWLLAIGVNVFNLAGTVLLFRAFTIGNLAVVSPITASFAMISAALAYLSGERAGALALSGALLVIVGVIVVSRSPGVSLESLRGVPESLGAALCLGIFFWGLGYVAPQLGAALPVLVGRALTFSAALVFFVTQRQVIQLVPRAFWPLILSAIVFDTGAFLAYNSGINGSYTTVVVALASVYSAVTVLLAWLLLRERLAASQWGGIVVILVGVLMISL
jgi:drug/metabolite transporter (DMT)-like permease